MSLVSSPVVFVVLLASMTLTGTVLCVLARKRREETDEEESHVFGELARKISLHFTSLPLVDEGLKNTKSSHVVKSTCPIDATRGGRSRESPPVVLSVYLCFFLFVYTTRVPGA